MPGVAAFLRTRDVVSLLTVLERKALEGDEEQGRRVDSFQPLPSSLIIERLLDQCRKLKLKAEPDFLFGIMTSVDKGPITRRKLNGIHAIIQAIPRSFPSKATELPTEPRLIVTNRSKTDGSVEFFAPDVPWRVAVSSASHCSGVACDLTSMLLCLCCEGALRGCGECAAACPVAGCRNKLICPDCSVLTSQEAEHPGQLVGCLDCVFKCAACREIFDKRQRARCDCEDCPHAFPGDTCQDCQGVDEEFTLQCRQCKGFRCADCESMIRCSCCNGPECRSCAEVDGEISVCSNCDHECCSGCTKYRPPCALCNKFLCHSCDDPPMHYNKCRRCEKRCCTDGCLARKGFYGYGLHCGEPAYMCKVCIEAEAGKPMSATAIREARESREMESYQGDY